jgi:uroporphyrinogen-III synthase
MRILSTKILSTKFKDRLIQHGFSVIEYPFIKINPLAVDPIKVLDYAIFTSQNAVKLAMENAFFKTQLKEKKCFCVGKKTQLLLEENGLKVIKRSSNALILANFIIKNHENSSFSFFCGTLRRPEIELLFSKNSIRLQIHELYSTIHQSKTIETPVEGVLFFSPSAVKSFFEKNFMTPLAHGFCIGSTTANTLKEYTNNYSTAKKTSENHLLLSILNYYNKLHA